MTKSALIKKYKNLFWYFDGSKLNSMSDDVLVEFILNYGSWQSFKDLIETMGLSNVERRFNMLRSKKRTNLLHEVSRFFHLYFKHHAS